MATTRMIITFGDRTFKIRVLDPCSVAALQIKLRKHLQMNEHEAMFLFFRVGYMERERLFPAQATLAEIARQVPGDVVYVSVLRENCFGHQYSNAAG